MDAETTAQRRAFYESRILHYTRLIAELQATCEHIYVRKVAQADTGNYDRSQDRYWFDCECPECRKRWTEPQ